MHAYRRAGAPLTADGLDAVYYDLVKQYYGPSVAFDEQDAHRLGVPRLGISFTTFLPHPHARHVYKVRDGHGRRGALARAILDGEPGALSAT